MPTKNTTKTIRRKPAKASAKAESKSSTVEEVPETGSGRWRAPERNERRIEAALRKAQKAAEAMEKARAARFQAIHDAYQAGALCREVADTLDITTAAASYLRGAADKYLSEEEQAA